MRTRLCYHYLIHVHVCQVYMYTIQSLIHCSLPYRYQHLYLIMCNNECIFTHLLAVITYCSTYLYSISQPFFQHKIEGVNVVLYQVLQRLWEEKCVSDTRTNCMLALGKFCKLKEHLPLLTNNRIILMLLQP